MLVIDGLNADIIMRYQLSCEGPVFGAFDYRATIASIKLWNPSP